MLIPPDDPIWQRLYGPYGAKEVVTFLQQLDDVWDEALAHDLFWGLLHHQEDLYPVTYAALPWLWRMAERREDGRVETLQFLSWVIYCAMQPDGIIARGRYRGLSTDPAAHHHPWLTEAERLSPDDRPVLAALEQWFSDTAGSIAAASLAAVPKGDKFLAGYLTVGPAALRCVAARVLPWRSSGGLTATAKTICRSQQTTQLG